MRRTRLLLWIATGLFLALVLGSSSVSALCGPRLAWLQVVSNPPSPDPDYQSVHTITFLCPDQGCHGKIVRDNPAAQISWTFSNDFDDHVRSCTLNIHGQVCSGAGHGYHFGHNLTSTLSADEAPQAAQIAWFPCGSGII